MATYYTTTQLIALARDSANTIGLPTEYSSADGAKAYDYAMARCGYANPASSDTDYGVKQRWLLELMNLYFLYDVQRRYLLKFDVGDLKLGQVSKNVKEMIATREGAFERAKADSATAAIFQNAATFFGTMVHKSGIADDAYGQSVDQEDL